MGFGVVFLGFSERFLCFLPMLYKQHLQDFFLHFLMAVCGYSLLFFFGSELWKVQPSRLRDPGWFFHYRKGSVGFPTNLKKA